MATTMTTIHELPHDYGLLGIEGSRLMGKLAGISGNCPAACRAESFRDFPAGISRYVRALVSGADFAKGSRFIAGGGVADFMAFRRFGNKVLDSTASALRTTTTDRLRVLRTIRQDCVSAKATKRRGYAAAGIS